jgi:predicted nucleotidyltransferase
MTDPNQESRPASGESLDPRVLEEIVRRVVAVAHPDRILLFGSAARGDMGPDSDVDLLVVKSGVPHRRRLAQAIHRAMAGVAAAVDVLVVTPEDIERSRDKVGPISRPALREGVEVYAA